MGDWTLQTQRFARFADISAVQNKPMVRVRLISRRHVVLDRALNDIHVFSAGDPGSVRDSKYVRVHGLRGWRNHMLMTTFAVLRPTPGRLCNAVLDDGTSPANSSTIIFDNRMTFFALLRYSPMDLM